MKKILALALIAGMFMPLVGTHPYRVIWKPFKSESLLQMIENATPTKTVDPEGTDA